MLATEFNVGAMSPVVEPDQVLSKTTEEEIDELYGALDLSMKKEPEEENIMDDEVFDESANIDDDIKPIIALLNRKGYKTSYSCSGHPSGRFKNDRKDDGVKNAKLYSTARVVFDGVYDNITVAPKGWKKKTLNTTDDKKGNERTAIYVNFPYFKIVDATPKNAFYKWKQKYMRALKSWAEALPDADTKKEKENVTVESLLDELILDTL